MKQENSNHILKGSSLASSLNNYNSTLSSKLNREKQSVVEWRSIWESMVSSLNIKPDNTVDEMTRKKTYLKMIDRLQTILESKAMIINIKKKVNDNAGKLSVMRILVKDPDDVTEELEIAQRNGESLEKELERVKNEGQEAKKKLEKVRVENNEMREVEEKIVEANQKIKELKSLL